MATVTSRSVRPPRPPIALTTLCHERLGSGCAGRDAECAHPGQQLRLDVLRALDQLCAAAGALGDLDQAARIGGVLRPDDEDQLAVARDRAHRVLAVLGRVADVLGGRDDERGEALAQRVDDLGGLVDGERCLCQHGHRVGVLQVDLAGLRDAGDHARVGGRLADRALDLLVVGMADQHDLVVARCEAPGLGVDLGDQRAGRVDHVEPALERVATDRRGDAVGGEDHRRSGRDLVDVVDEHRAARLQLADDVGVVDDLLAHIHRGAALLQRALDDLDRPRHPGAGGARGRQRELAVAERLGPALEQRAGLAQRAEGASRGDRGSGGAVELIVRGVQHDAQRRQRLRAGVVGEPRRLHVDRQGAGERELAPALAEDQSAARDDRPDVHAQATSAQDAGEDRRVRARQRLGVGAQLAGEHHVAWLEARVQRAADARDQRRAAGRLVRQPRGRAGAARAHADPLDAAPRRAGSDRARLERHRREHEQARAFVRLAVAVCV